MTDFILDIKDWLAGKKTWFVVLAGAIVFVLNQIGVIDAGLANTLYTALGITTVATLNAKLNREG